MLKVSNKACIKQLSKRSFRASKTRNIIAILAIALTTILFTSLFTVGLSANKAFQESNFRQVGGYCHGGFKYLSEEQFHELRDDPLIKEWGVSRVLGFPTDEVFRKNHVEVRWSNANAAHWMYLDPIEGRLPQEGTNEAATDLEVLSLLGVEPVLGNEFTVNIDVNGKPTEQTFTLCGWWEKDPIVVANMIIIPESRVDSVLDELDIALPTVDKLTGSWCMDVMFKNARHIQKDLDTVLENHGYQREEANQPDSVNTGVNWGYTGAQASKNADPVTVLMVVLLLLLIIFTGYLIIYNVFQISVVNDIRFYGLLKTIGTTGKQIKAIIRRQALMLCVFGIPLGCLIGWFIGSMLTPVILSRLNGVVAGTVSASPLIFFLSAVFALFTVGISCSRPGRMAAKVSPVEAVRYTEGSSSKNKKQKKNSKAFSLIRMAWGNLGRSKGKTFVTILSLTLAVVLLQLTSIFTNGFDMDKYLQDKSICDFIFADGGYFDNNVYTWPTGGGVVPEGVIEDVISQGGISEGGRVYGQLKAIQEFAPEDWVRQNKLQWGDAERVDYEMKHAQRSADGRVMEDTDTYGMDKFALDRLTLIQGDLSPLYESGSKAIAAVVFSDDYNQPIEASHWANVGDTVTLRMPTAWEFYNPETGEAYESYDAAGNNPIEQRPSEYHDETFTVTALVTVPGSINYRYYGSDQFIMNSDTFKDFAGEDADVMLYAFDTADEKTEEMESFLQDYTNNVNPRYGYESKQIYVDEFNSFRSMFIIVGSLLSFIVGLVGILNFVNAILTGILTRRREFAMLQSIGMTGKQLKTMLVWEGLMYALGAVIFGLILSILAGPAVEAVLKVFWFFSYKPDITAILTVAPIFALLGIFVPLIVYKRISKFTIVERLREAED